MSLRIRVGVVLASVVLVTATCGGSATMPPGDGGSDGAGAAGSSGGAGDGVPPQCQIQGSGQPPYEVVFNFRNMSGETLFVRSGCILEYGITSCADGYEQELWRDGSCKVDCAAPPEATCIACDSCPLEGVEVTLNGTLSEIWDGTHYTYGTNSANCPCHDDHLAAAGKYRVTIPVFASADAAQLNQPLREVVVDFELPAVDGVVDVSLSGT